MGKPDLVEDFNIGPSADPIRGGGPLADSIDGEDRRLVKRSTEKRAGRMGEVMLTKENFILRDP
jgi:hypothetical protein